MMIKETIVLAALAISSPAVVDGDTVRIAGVSIRLTDYDSPELFHPKCPWEQMWAEAAKLELERVLDQVKLVTLRQTFVRRCHGGNCPAQRLKDEIILAHPHQLIHST